MPPKKRQQKKEEGSSARRRLDLDEKTPPRSSKQSEVVDLTESPPRKRGVDSYFGKKKPEQAAAFQTPPKTSRRGPREEPEPPSKRRRVKEDEYVPTHIHKNVDYKRKGKANISNETLETFELVEKHFVIPDDFEQSRKYGPLSGVSFEERAISAYALGLLEPKTAESANVKICSVCAVEGHKRNDCPQLV